MKEKKAKFSNSQLGFLEGRGEKNRKRKVEFSMENMAARFLISIEKSKTLMEI